MTRAKEAPIRTRRDGGSNCPDRQSKYDLNHGHCGMIQLYLTLSAAVATLAPRKS